MKGRHLAEDTPLGQEGWTGNTAIPSHSEPDSDAVGTCNNVHLITGPKGNSCLDLRLKISKK